MGHWAFKENKSLGETMSKEEIEAAIAELESNVNSTIQQTNRSIQEIDNNFLERVLLDDDYIIDLRFTSAKSGRKLLVNTTNHNITIKIQNEVFGNEGTPCQVFCYRNGTVETKSGTTTGQHGSMPFIMSTFLISWFTLAAGNRAIVETYDFWTTD